MDTKTTGIVAYITWVGLLIAFLAGDKQGAKFHINQSLVITIISVAVSIISTIFIFIPIIGWIIGIVLNIVNVACFVFMIMGIISAANGEEKPLPIIGGIKIIK